MPADRPRPAGAARAPGGVPGPAVTRRAEGGARRRHAGRDQRPEQPDVGDGREPRRHRLRGRLLRRRPRRAVARQPRHLGAEGQHRQRLQPDAVTTDPARPGSRSRPPTSIPPCSRAAASSACSTATRSTPTSPTRRPGATSARRTTRWSAARSAASTSSAAACLYDARHELVGGVGVSGDTSCADHNIAWRVRADARTSTSSPASAASAATRAARQHRVRHHRQPGRRHGRQRGRLRTSDVPQHGRPSTLPAVRDAATRPRAGAHDRDRRLGRAGPRRAGDGSARSASVPRSLARSAA